MNNLLNFLPKKTLILIAVLVFLILILLSIRLFTTQNNPSQTNPVITFNPSPATTPIQIRLENKNTISPLQKSIIGKTTKEEIEKRQDILKKENISSNVTTYTFQSSFISRPSEITFTNNVASYELTRFNRDDSNFMFPKVAELIQKFGQPSSTTRGSSFYGYNVKTYIYPEIGLAFVAEIGSEKVYEIQTFEPTILGEYMKKYGQHIQEGGEPNP